LERIGKNGPSPAAMLSFGGTGFRDRGKVDLGGATLLRPQVQQQKSLWEIGL
jgi:hypothetical protein